MLRILTENFHSFDYIEKQIRNKTFGILSTVSPKFKPQSSGILYSVSLPNSKFALYVITSQNYVKVRNIRKNPNVSFVIPFPHYFLRFVPSSTVYFQGTAEILPINHLKAQKSFSQKRFLRKILNDFSRSSEHEEMVFIRIKPKRKICVYGLGFTIRQLRKEHVGRDYSVTIPLEKY